jgi:hypothetical protein
MTDKIRFLASKGKYTSKEDLEFYASASLEDLEKVEKSQKDLRFWWLDELDKRGEIDPYNRPSGYGLDFDRWLLKKYGLTWYVDYVKTHLVEYKDHYDWIPARLRALRVPEAEIQAVLKPKKAIREQLHKVCVLGNKLRKVLPQKDAFIKAWAIVKAGGLEVPVQGVSYGSRQEALRRLAGYSPTDIKVFITPEPENPVDKNAAAVMVGVQNGKGLYCLGYIPKELAPAAPVMKTVGLRLLEGTTRGARLALAV